MTQNAQASIGTKPDNGFGFWRNPYLAAGLALLWIIILLLFRTFPAIDLAVAHYFYDAELCAGATKRCIGFPTASHSVAAPLREVLNYSPRFLGVGVLMLLLYQLSRGKRWRDIALRKTVLVAGALIIGPLLVVNSILKEFFGRVRPRNVFEYGGTMDFTAAGDFIGQCVSNCSFVSGEASAGGWFLCLGVFFSPRLRPLAYLFLFIIGFGMALLRVAFGAHFISDALLGYLSSLVIFSILVWLSERGRENKSPG